MCPGEFSAGSPLPVGRVDLRVAVSGYSHSGFAIGPEAEPQPLWEHSRVTSYSRQDVLRILQIGCRQLQGWERAGLIAQQASYSFQDLGQLRTLRVLREEEVSAASIRHSILAMKAVAGMANPLLEACLVRTGTRLAFRHHGAMVDPIRRQLLFDFERLGRMDRPSAGSEPFPLRRAGGADRGVSGHVWRYTDNGFTIVNDSTIAAAAPSSSSYTTLDVAVKTIYGNTNTITIHYQPIITSISPASGSLNGNTLVTITGSGFTKAMGVFFGNTFVSPPI